MAIKRYPKDKMGKFVQIDASHNSGNLVALDIHGNVWLGNFKTILTTGFKWIMIPNKREILKFVDGSSMDIKNSGFGEQEKL